jgi:hypothetical protein
LTLALGTMHLNARARVGFGFGVGSGCGYYGGGPYFGFDTYRPPSREVVYVNSSSSSKELEKENAKLSSLVRQQNEEMKSLEKENKKQDKQQKKEVERLEKMIKRLEKKLKD